MERDGKYVMKCEWKQWQKTCVEKKWKRNGEIIFLAFKKSMPNSKVMTKDRNGVNAKRSFSCI